MESGKAVKLADVARAAGVSQGTVSNVFNRPDMVSQALREKVEATAQALGYKGPDPRGRLLRAGRVNAIGVVTSAPLSHFFDDPFTRLFLSEIARLCQARGAGLSLVSALDDESAAWNVRTALVDGFILNCLWADNRLLETARQRRLPFVAIDFEGDRSIDMVRIDDCWGAREAARHLINLGHSQFGVLSIAARTDGYMGPIDERRCSEALFGLVLDRLKGYAAAFEEAGLPPQPVYETNADPQSIGRAIDGLLATNPNITALLCMSDRVAILACAHLRCRGYSVPSDFSVIGFDGTIEAALHDPPITTLRQPVAEKAAAAVEMVFAAAGGRTGGRSEILPLTFVTAQSTARPRRS